MQNSERLTARDWRAVARKERGRLRHRLIELEYEESLADEASQEPRHEALPSSTQTTLTTAEGNGLELSQHLVSFAALKDLTIKHLRDPSPKPTAFIMRHALFIKLRLMCAYGRRFRRHGRPTSMESAGQVGHATVGTRELPSD